jgi:hypothetical protein
MIVDEKEVWRSDVQVSYTRVLSQDMSGSYPCCGVRKRKQDKKGSANNIALTDVGVVSGGADHGLGSYGWVTGRTGES